METKVQSYIRERLFELYQRKAEEIEWELAHYGTVILDNDCNVVRHEGRNLGT